MYFSNLPDVLLDIILQDYWIDYFRSNVIRHLNHVRRTISKIDHYYEVHKWCLLSRNLTKRIKLDLMHMNYDIMSITNEKGIKQIYSHFKNVPDFYHSVPEWCRHIAFYFVSQAHIDRYHLLYRFQQIEKSNV